jgi:sugar (pentulose or hexulose) kinase
MDNTYLLGLDAGTSVVKAALFDCKGQEVAVATRRTALYSPQPGWSEASMPETWAATITVIQEVLVTAGIANTAVAAVGLTGNMIGAWLIDAQGEPVRRAILWNDGRTQSLLERLIADHPSLMAEIFSFSGSVMQQGCSLPLTRWLAEYEPETLARAHQLLCCKDWLRFKLTGTLQTDPTEVSILPGNTRTQNYDNALFDLLGISQYRRLFPPVAPSEAVIGEVTPAAAAATGLRAGTPVVTGAGDVSAVALGVGAVEPGVACTILGTTCLNCLVFDQPIFEPANVGLLFYLPGQRWLRSLANIAGTTNLDWFINQFYASERDAAASRAELFAKLENLAQQSEIGARGIIYHPYLSSVGVIAPFVEPAARAQFFGLSLEHQTLDLLRAVYEGVALAIRDCYHGLDIPPAEIRLSGGGAKSAWWCQMIADCTGAKVMVPAGHEFGAKGAALLAGVGLGWYQTIAEAATTTVRFERNYEPDLDRHSQYDTIYDLYQALHQQLRHLWQRRSRLKGAI